MAYLISGLIIREGGFRNSEQEGLITKSPVPKGGGGGLERVAYYKNRLPNGGLISEGA